MHHMFDLVRPAAIFVEDLAPFANALASLDLGDIECFDQRGFDDLAATVPTVAVETAFAAVAPDNVAKYLFTSGPPACPRG